MPSEFLIELTAEIVAAHAENNKVSGGELPGLIQAIHGALAALGQSATPEPEQLTPAVPIRSSVKPDAITCLDCGAKFKMLKRHLTTDHGLTPAEYRARWDLKADYPIVAPHYAAKRRDLALTNGLGRKPKAPMPAPKRARKTAPKA
jgi:predicted transcriptional regulator